MEMIRKSQPTPGDVHVNRPLTQISLAFLQNAASFVADRVFPNIPVDKQGDLYYTFDRGMFNRDQMQKRAPGTESQGVGYSVSTDNYFADLWALHHDIPDQRRANTDQPLSPDREATELLTHQALIKRESEWMASHFTTGQWTTDLAGVNAAPAGGQFLQWDVASSDPIGDVETGKQVMGGSTGFEPNTLVLDRRTWGVLKEHPQIIGRLDRGQTQGPAQATLESAAALLELDRILVSRAIQNTAAEGAANAHSYIAGDNALLCYVAPTPGLMTPSAGYTFSWRGMLGAAAAGQRISRFRMEQLKSDRVEIEMAWDQKLVAADLGYFFSDTLDGV